MYIFGAGMSGCLAGVLNPQATILEKQVEPPINHNAVLRFRDDSVSKATGIPFEKVKVHKGIFAYGKFRQPDIMFANLYSQKVIGKILPRSIWNLEPVYRYVAPDNFQYQLYDLVSNKVDLGCDIDDLTIKDINGDTIISTIPMPVMLKILKINHSVNFDYQKIWTKRFEVKNCNVHQTIYFPCDENNVYRATLTGNQLIIESISEEFDIDLDLLYIISAFGIDIDDVLIQVESSKQQYGKIAEINDSFRRSMLYDITRVWNIYSAGRFAIWKNILMDDVLQDLRVIKEMQAKDSYEHHRRF